MAYTARTLITRALYLSGIVSRNLQTPTGDQINDGLFLLNALLDFKQVETDLIPYYQYITFPCVSGQEFYFLPYVALLESLTFNLDVIRYNMDFVSRTNYYGSARVDNISTLPFSWNYNRSLGGGNLALYFKPDKAYALKAMAKIFLVDVNLNTDLTNITESTPYTFINNSNQGLDTAYIEYLRYSLAEYICAEYNISFNPESAKKLISMRRQLMYLSPPDLSMQKATILCADSQVGWNWGDVNLGRGWRPA
jgi:hypothetical protein